MFRLIENHCALGQSAKIRFTRNGIAVGHNLIEGTRMLSKELQLTGLCAITLKGRINRFQIGTVFDYLHLHLGEDFMLYADVIQNKLAQDTLSDDAVPDIMFKETSRRAFRNAIDQVNPSLPGVAEQMDINKAVRSGEGGVDTIVNRLFGTDLKETAGKFFFVGTGYVGLSVVFGITKLTALLDIPISVLLIWSMFSLVTMAMSGYLHCKASEAKLPAEIQIGPGDKSLNP